MPDNIKKDIADTLAILTLCETACSEFASAAKELPEDLKLRMAISLCRDCEQICHSTYEFLERRSTQIKKILRLCGDLCHKCADELSRIPDIAGSRKCLELCRECAVQCVTIS